jgi:hypothetical protein
MAGPWLLVTLGQRSEGSNEAFALYPFAIWKATGDVYVVGGDDSIFRPERRTEDAEAKRAEQ